MLPLDVAGMRLEHMGVLKPSHACFNVLVHVQLYYKKHSSPTQQFSCICSWLALGITYGVGRLIGGGGVTT